MRDGGKKKWLWLLVLPLLLSPLPAGALQAAPGQKTCVALRVPATPAEADLYWISFGPAFNADLRQILTFTTPKHAARPAPDAFPSAAETMIWARNLPAAWNCQPVKAYALALKDEAALRQQPPLPRLRPGKWKSSLTFDAVPALPGLPAEDTPAQQHLLAGRLDKLVGGRFVDAVWNAPAVQQARQQLRPEVQRLLEEWKNAGRCEDMPRFDAIEDTIHKAEAGASQEEKQKIARFFALADSEFKKRNGVGPATLQATPQTEAHYQALYRNQIAALLPTLDAAQSTRTVELFRSMLEKYKNNNLKINIILLPEKLAGLSPEPQATMVRYNKALKKALQKELLRARVAKRDVKFITQPV